jgi:ABC1 atypical kinase-like domain
MVSVAIAQVLPLHPSTESACVVIRKRKISLRASFPYATDSPYRLRIWNIQMSPFLFFLLFLRDFAPHTVNTVVNAKRWDLMTVSHQLHGASPLAILLSRRGGSASTISPPDQDIWNGTLTVTNSTTSNDASLVSDSTDLFHQQCGARASFVKHILCQRCRYVCSGQRGKDFASWMRDNKNDASIVSIHGLPLSHTPKVTENRTPADTSLSTLSSKQRKKNKNDPFPIDRTNLNIVSTSQTPTGCFVDASDSMSLDVHAPSIWQLGFRMIQLSFHFAPVWSTLCVALISKRFRQHYWYKWMATSIGSSGAAWIKWGQWSGTRNDMFPEALCDQLSTLHAAAPAHAWSYSALSVEQALGLGAGTLLTVFDAFDPRPLASGSIAQVHKAVLCGQPVAVKIRHPNVRQLMEMDFRLMTLAARIVDQLPALQWLHIRESVEQFSHAISAQAHLQVEAHHLEVLNYNFRRWPRVSFPKPFFASASTIIETFEPGKITTDVIDQYDAMAAFVSRNCSDVQKGVTVIEEDMELLSSPLENATDTSNAKISGHDLMPLSLSKFLVSTGVSLYLKMLLVDNLVRFFANSCSQSNTSHRQFWSCYVLFKDAC